MEKALGMFLEVAIVVMAFTALIATNDGMYGTVSDVSEGVANYINDSDGNQ